MRLGSDPSSKSHDRADPLAGSSPAGEHEIDAPPEDPWFKLKAFVVVEIVTFAIALVLPISPSKTGKPFKWPATWGDYFEDVALSFALGNIVLLLIVVVGWIYVRCLKRRSTSTIRDSES